MKFQSDTRKKWRWDLIGVGFVALVFWLIATPPSAYFLQIDTAAQDYVALALTRNCWEFFTEKMLAVLLLHPLFWLFGPSPYWETALLAVAATLNGIAAYELARLSSDSRLAGIVALLLLNALPFVQFFNRAYFGYLFPCVLGGGWQRTIAIGGGPDFVSVWH